MFKNTIGNLICSVICVTCHEVLLQLRFKSYIMDETDRNGLLNANKEGILSSTGYLSIYLFSVWFGSLLFKYR